MGLFFQVMTRRSMLPVLSNSGNKNLRKNVKCVSNRVIRKLITVSFPSLEFSQPLFAEEFPCSI